MAHALSIDSIPASAISGERLAPRSRSLRVAGVIFIAVGVAMGWGGSPNFLAKAWLQGWLFAVSLSLGALFFVIIQHLTRAGWSVADLDLV